jgi:hypothetical protein
MGVAGEAEGSHEVSSGSNTGNGAVIGCPVISRNIDEGCDLGKREANARAMTDVVVSTVTDRVHFVAGGDCGRATTDIVVSTVTVAPFDKTKPSHLWVAGAIALTNSGVVWKVSGVLLRNGQFIWKHAEGANKILKKAEKRGAKERDKRGGRKGTVCFIKSASLPLHPPDGKLHSVQYAFWHPAQ